jgi:hypothetical protein
VSTEYIESSCHHRTLFIDGIENFPQDASNPGFDTAHAANTTPTTDAADDADPADPIDATDADLLEILANHSTPANPEQDHPVEARSVTSQ